MSGCPNIGVCGGGWGDDVDGGIGVSRVGERKASCYLLDVNPKT